MTRVLALAVSLTLVAIGALHVYWAFGGGWSADLVIPSVRGKRAFVPPAWLTLLVAAALFAAAGAVARRARLIFVGPEWIATIATWLFVLVFGARVIGDFRLVGLFKTVRGTPFAHWDDVLYTPLCYVLAVSCLWIARSRD